MTALRHPPPAEADILIAGLVRNGARTLGPNLDALASAAAGFGRVRMLVIESDSTDATPDLLAARSGADFRAISLGRLENAHPLRTDRIAQCRNRIVDEVVQAYPGVDYVIVADLDGVNLSLRRKDLEGVWRRDLPWDVVTANQAGPYYDIWALRHPVWSPDDCWAAARKLAPIFGRRAARRLCVSARRMRLPADAGLIEVDSAFGGLGIYRREAFLAGRYRGLDAAGGEICEHVPFHAMLRAAGYRIFIDAALRNTSPLEHAPILGWPVRRVRGLFRRAGR